MSNHREGTGEKDLFVVRQEPDRVDRLRVAVGALLTALGIAVAIGVTMLFMRDSDDRPRSSPHAAAARTTPLETSLILSTERGLALRAEQRAKLGRYGWVDRDAGVAEIPIERAMDLVGESLPDGGLRR